MGPLDETTESHADVSNDSKEAAALHESNNNNNSSNNNNNNNNNSTPSSNIPSPRQQPCPLGPSKRFPRDWLKKLIRSSSNSHAHDVVLHDKALVVAPMVDQSDLPFRLLCRRYGANLAVTPMIHARMFVEKECYRARFWPFPHGTPSTDRPLVAQFCGGDAAVLLQAASAIQHQVDAVDLNCGCPQTIAKRGKYGAFLLEDADTLVHIVRVLSAQLDVPVTVKVRLLPHGGGDDRDGRGSGGNNNSNNNSNNSNSNSNNNNNNNNTHSSHLSNSLALYRELVRAGASMITVHGRTRFQKGQETGPCDWDAIAKVVKDPKVGGQVPVLANGSVADLQEARNCLLNTKADGVMSSEAILEYPAMFHNIECEQSGGRSQQLPEQQQRVRQLGRVRLAREFLALATTHPPHQGGQGSGLKCVRVHLHRILHADLQDNMELRNRLVTAKTYQQLQDIIDTVDQHQQQQNHGVGDERPSWYVRHRIKESQDEHKTKSQVAWEKTKIIKCVELDDETALGIIDMFGNSNDDDDWG